MEEEEPSRGFPGGLGFVAAMFMGQDRLGDVRVRAVAPLPLLLAARGGWRPRHSSSALEGEAMAMATAMAYEKAEDEDEDEVSRATATAASTVPTTATTTTTTAMTSFEAARAAFASGIRIASFSPPSERCDPLLVMHTASLDRVWLKLDDLHARSLSRSPSPTASLDRDKSLDGNDDDVPSSSSRSLVATESPLRRLYKTCIQEAKVAVVPVDGSIELHLVAMKTTSKSEDPTTNNEISVMGDGGSFFWGFVLPKGVYTQCLTMLNRRCLALVLDLDETLILANTMRSFEDRIDALKAQIDKHRFHLPSRGTVASDVTKLANLTAELKRFTDDRALLKQFVDSDCVIVDNGRIVTPICEERYQIIRPVIRIPEHNVILTRINPAVRDTSVLVRIRPAWAETRGYLVCKERLRFQVYINTMSERDYALEMWRLLDPEARLIESSELHRRLICVNAGSKKSLASMFEQINCHPRLAMVVDDRPEVWEERDHAHVYAISPFSPYYAPQAENNGVNPPLWIARNVACHVRAGFFKDFDEVLPHKFAQVSFNTDASTLPDAPHVGNYLKMHGCIPPESLNNVPKEFADGIANSEVQSALYHKDEPRSRENGHVTYTHSNINEVTAAGGWLEAEDEDQAQPDSPSNNNAENGGTDSQQENANGNSVSAEVPSKDEEELCVIARALNISDPIAAIKEFGEMSETNVEFKCSLRPTEKLQFSADVFCDGKKIGSGYGRTNKEAKSHAADEALKFLRHEEKVPDTNVPNSMETQKKGAGFDAVAALKDMCTIEGSKIEYLELPSSRKGLFICEVQIGGQILGKGSGPDIASAKHEAAEQALRATAAPKPRPSNTHKKRYSPPPQRPAKRSRPPPAPSTRAVRERAVSPRRSSYPRSRRR